MAGWVHRRRDHGGVIFVDLRDREGLLQVVADPSSQAVFAEAERVRSEFVLVVTGKVRRRPEGTVNPKLPTGEVELLATDLKVLNTSETPPFHHDEDANEDLRLRYRFLDLRREEMTRAPAAAPQDHADAAQLPRCRGLHRRRDADADAHDAGGRARLHRPEPHAPRQVLRAAPVAAALQAAPDDVGHGPLLPGRALLPRRGPARGSPARVHAARHRDLLHGRGRHHEGHGGADPRSLQEDPRRRTAGSRCRA